MAHAVVVTIISPSGRSPSDPALQLSCVVADSSGAKVTADTKVKPETDL